MINLRPALEALARRLPPPRVIGSRDGESPYLSRYYLVGRELSDVNPFLDERTRRVLFAAKHHGVYLHHFHRGDDERELHSHPFRWSCALILAGGYVEERRMTLPAELAAVGKPYLVEARTLRPGMINLLRHDTFHRVELLEKDAWTLFVTGPKIASWSFWDRDTGKETSWVEFIHEVRDPQAFARRRAG
jgi:hypothetical protein